MAVPTTRFRSSTAIRWKSSETASVQAEYDRYTDQAIAASVFGSPWYQYEGEGYWGQDRLDFLERAFGK